MTTVKATADQPAEELKGKRVLSTQGDAVIITGPGTVKRVYPRIDDEADVTNLTKQSIGINNKLLREKLEASFPGEVKLNKGWLTVRGFRLRYAPAGFEMYDVQNFKTPIDLGETPEIKQVVTFIEKPNMSTLTKNRTPAPKKPVPAKPSQKSKTDVAPDKDAPVIVDNPEPLTDEEKRAAGIKMINNYARKDARSVEVLRKEINMLVDNRKYRTQVNKLFSEFLTKRPAKQTAEFKDFIGTLRTHLKGFDFAPAPVKAPKFTGLEEIDYKGGILESTDPFMVEYKNKGGKKLSATLVHFLLHDVLYNWPDYYTVIMYLANSKQPLEEILAGELVVKDIYCEFDKKVVEAYAAEPMLDLLYAIYEYQEEATPLQFVWDAKLKVGAKIAVKWTDLKTTYYGEVISNMPVEINYTDMAMELPLLKHQNYIIK
jgi:hypothetical protein